jgi:hypothetical protein
LTNGDKTIEYTKKLSICTNKIYANEKLQTLNYRNSTRSTFQNREQKQAETDKVEQLRANEQVELKLLQMQIKADGKIDVEKLSEEDAVVYKVYDKYDKLITPLLEDVVDSSVKQDEEFRRLLKIYLRKRGTSMKSTDKTFKLRDKQILPHTQPSKKWKIKVEVTPWIW